MNLAISNIAWNNNQDQAVFELMNQFGFSGLEIAPSKIWDDPVCVSQEQTDEYKAVLSHHDIQMTGVQSALFGHPELRLFESEQVRNDLLQHLEKVVRVCSQLGGRVLVFGNPKNRVKGLLSTDEADKIAVTFFQNLAERANKYGVVIGLEPNSVEYGTDFMNTSAQALEIVKMVNHDNVKLHLDLGVMQLNNEDIKKTIEQAAPFLCHFHISEPMLKPFISSNHHKVASQSLRSIGYDNWVSIEMAATSQEDNIEVVKNALSSVADIYGRNI